MNEIILKDDLNVMTSLQIAEATGKRHANVIRDIDNMLSQLSDNQVKLTSEFNKNGYLIQQSSYKDPLGRGKRMYSLNKKACLLLASGYDVILRSKIIDRWEELETKARFGGFDIPQSFSQALLLASQLQEKVEKQEKEIEEQKRLIEYQTPLANLGDAIEKYDDDIPISEMAKILNQNGYETGDHRFRARLKEDGYMQRNGLPTQRSMEMGVLAIVKIPYEKPNGGKSVYTKTMVTNYGQRFFVNKYVKPKRELCLVN